jgi:hypothetical protein
LKFRLGNYNDTQYHIIRTPFDSGSVSLIFTQTGSMAVDSRLVIDTTGLNLYDVDFNNFVVEEITENNLLETFGTHEYTITDSEGSICNTSVDIEVPNPLPDMISIKPFESDTYYNGTNAKIYIYGKTGYNVYVNWGDGSPIAIRTSTGDFYHTYEDTTKRYNIDVWGGVDGFYSGYYRNELTVNMDWFNSFDRQLSKIYIYHGSIDGTFDRFINPPLYIYYYYNSFAEGDIGNLKNTYSLNSTKLTTIYEHSHTSFQPSLHGDIGTYLKGNIVNEQYKKYILLYRTGRFTYLDRLDAPLFSTKFQVRGYNTTANSVGIAEPNQVAQLIVDLDTWLDRASYKTVDVRYCASPNNADEPLLSEFITAKANLIADGFAVYHS